ncbi:hypothetical protein OG948_31650 [Embleya sp. NBC_00888]|nr:hypothetical protein OG948_31650 [Embleya sp. NBC_00888]
MHDTGPVRGDECRADPVGDRQRAAGVDRGRFLDGSGECGTVDLLHDEEQDVLVRATVVEGNDVRVVDPGRGDRLAFEAFG